MDHVIRDLFAADANHHRAPHASGSLPSAPLRRRRRRHGPHDDDADVDADDDDDDDDLDELDALRRDNARLRRERDVARRSCDRALAALAAEARQSARLRRERDDAERDLAREVRAGDRLREERDRARRRRSQGQDQGQTGSFASSSSSSRAKDEARSRSRSRGPRVVVAGVSGGSRGRRSSVDDGEEWDTWYDDARRYAHTCSRSEGIGRKKLDYDSDGTTVGDYGGMSRGDDEGSDELQYDGEDDAATEKSDDWMDGGWFSELLAGDA